MKLALLFIAFSCASYAHHLETLHPIEVTPPKDLDHGSHLRYSSDSARMLEETPGMSFQQGSPVTSLPVMQGLADDRISISIDGARITSSCSNHMNPALTYIDPQSVETMEVFAGIPPVSQGGDSIAGTIIVKPKAPEFSSSRVLLQKLNLRSFYRSNNEATGGSVKYSLASEKNLASYEGSTESAHNYRDGEGDRLRASLYERTNHALILGRKLETGVATLRYVHTLVPYEGFLNQRMDLENNTSNLLTANYRAGFGSVLLETSASYQHTNHLMDIIRSQREGDMPMYTRSDEMGFAVKALHDFSDRHMLTVGTEYHRYRLDDWWPGLEGVTAIMGPGEFRSMNNGKRDRLAFFTELDSEWTTKFSTNLGVRTDIVMTDTGGVRGYNDTNNSPADATAFNQKDRKKIDHNIDLTLSTRYLVNANVDLELGGGQKSRSPNLYERYAWGGSVTDPTNMADLSSMSASMDMLMINWFGDGNGYVGNTGLRPEVARKLSASVVAHDEERRIWEVKLTPHFTDVKNFIDADLIGTSDGKNYLRFENRDAVIFGADLSSKLRLGSFELLGTASYVRGYRKDGRAELYHLMPLNGKISLGYSEKKFTGELITHLVSAKKQVSDLRNEPETAGYGLLDLGSSYQFSRLLRVEAGIRNLLDHQYGLPLGGVDLVNSPDNRRPVSGMGRSFNLTLNLDFI